MNAADKTERVLRYLGLAAKAGKMIAGVPLIRTALARGRGERPLLIVRAATCAKNSAERVEKCAAFYGVPVFVADCDTATLAKAVGKRESAVAAVAVCDAHLFEAILRIQNEA